MRFLGYVSVREHEATLKQLRNPYNSGDLNDHLYLKNRIGNTTRTIDLAIQTLFKKREVEFCDHRKTEEANRRAMKILLFRLQAEHGIRREDVNHRSSKHGVKISFRKKTR